MRHNRQAPYVSIEILVQDICIDFKKEAFNNLNKTYTIIFKWRLIIKNINLRDHLVTETFDVGWKSNVKHFLYSRRTNKKS